MQHVEVRRQVRFLDLPLGGTIRASYRVLSWDLHPPTDVRIPRGHRVGIVDDYDLARYVGWQSEAQDGAPGDDGPGLVGVGIRFGSIGGLGGAAREGEAAEAGQDE